MFDNPYYTISFALSVISVTLAIEAALMYVILIKDKKDISP